MNFNLFLADKIGTRADATGRLSRTGSVISVVSVALSIAVIIAATAVSGGFRKEIRETLSGYTGDIILAEPGEEIAGESGPVTGILSYRGQVEALPFVERMSGVAYRYGILKTDGEIGGVLFKGVDSTYNMDFFKESIKEGRIPELGGNGLSNEIIISGKLANELNYKVGDKITAYFVDNQVKVRRFTLVGIFDPRLEQLDKWLAVADVRHISRLNGWGEDVSGYELSLNSKATPEQLNQLEETIYRFTTEEDTPLAVTTVEEKYSMLFDWLRLLDINVLIILILMIAVAGFNMVSGLLIMLFERIPQIGLFKALGMTNRAIAGIFLAKSALVVLKGMLWGNIVAIVLCLLQKHFHIITLNPDNYFVSSVPVHFNITWILGMNIVSFVAIMVVMLLPCLFISGISPASTMRVK